MGRMAGDYSRSHAYQRGALPSLSPSRRSAKAHAATSDGRFLTLAAPWSAGQQPGLVFRPQRPNFRQWRAGQDQALLLSLGSALRRRHNPGFSCESEASRLRGPRADAQRKTPSDLSPSYIDEPAHVHRAHGYTGIDTRSDWQVSSMITIAPLRFLSLRRILEAARSRVTYASR